MKVEGSFYDYLNVQSDTKLVKFLEKETGRKISGDMYSDYVTRVGTNMKRKLRIMVMFGKGSANLKIISGLSCTLRT